MDATRTLALALLQSVLESHRTMETALDRLPVADARDRAAAHRLAACVLRRLGTLDAVIEPHLSRAPPPTVRLVLALGAAQFLFLGTGAHAAVATSVDLARSAGLAPFAKLANAVLRRVCEQGPALLAELDSPRLDTPAWLWSSWGTDARAIATAHQTEAPLDITLAAPEAAPPGGEMLPTGSVRFPAGTRVTELPGFAEGKFWVQDAAAALPARLLDARPGERVADLCAAPGGKTAQLAASGAHVTAVERDAGRLARLAENLARLRLQATLVQADVLEWRPAEKFDAVLLDAPCSATGTMRRHPDIAHLRRPSDVAELAATQAKLIAAAARLLKPGGRLIYAVCSLQPEEGAQVLSTGGLDIQPFTETELQAVPQGRTVEGFLRTHPGMGMDGFFVGKVALLS
jgi:16S rRNA (cytosine967-C5)-methyltransferase